MQYINYSGVCYLSSSLYILFGFFWKTSRIMYLNSCYIILFFIYFGKPFDWRYFEIYPFPSFWSLTSKYFLDKRNMIYLLDQNQEMTIFNEMYIKKSHTRYTIHFLCRFEDWKVLSEFFRKLFLKRMKIWYSHWTN